MTPLVIGNPENRRVRLFAEAWERATGSGTAVLSWESYLTEPRTAEPLLAASPVVRIDSPGENWRVEKLLLERGADAAEEEGTPDRITARTARGLDEETGRIRPLRQWYLGWSGALANLQGALRRHGATATTPPDVIRLLFDKRACHDHCRKHAIAVPALICAGPAGFDDVWEAMGSKASSSVFVKPGHGSSASGVIALRRNRGAAVARTTLVRNRSGFYNSLRVQRYESLSEIRVLVDFVCQQGAIAERWLPKSGFRGRTVDLRVVTTAGVATHFVLRSSRGPLTNLHLGNERGDVDALRAHLGAGWPEIPAASERVAASLPAALHLGIDLLLTSPSGRPVLAEANAFGDLLPGALDRRGRSTYDAQASALAAHASAAGR